MFAAALEIDLHLPDIHSLKAKRAVIKPILEGARRRFHVSAAEVAHQDQWQRAGLGIAVVAATEGMACAILDDVERFVWSFPEIEVITMERSWLEVG